MSRVVPFRSMTLLCTRCHLLHIFLPFEGPLDVDGPADWHQPYSHHERRMYVYDAHVDTLRFSEQWDKKIQSYNCTKMLVNDDGTSLVIPEGT